MNNTPPTVEDFPWRIVAFLGSLFAFTPLIRYVAGYLREARMKELREWFRTEDGKAFMVQLFLDTLEDEDRYMRDYLEDWWCNRHNRDRSRPSEEPRKLDRPGN